MGAGDGGCGAGRGGPSPALAGALFSLLTAQQPGQHFLERQGCRNEILSNSSWEIVEAQFLSETGDCKLFGRKHKELSVGLKHELR